jgi:hypothetical protein
MKYKILFVLIICLLFGCSQIIKNNIIDSIRSDIKNKISQNEKNIKINLSDFTSFKWDDCYIIDGPYSAEDIRNIMNIHYSGETNLSDDETLFFVFKDKIVYKEVFSDQSESEIQFNKINQNDKVPHYTFNNSKFKVSVEETYEGSGKMFYNLVPIK